jgi:hypothetical protein
VSLEVADHEEQVDGYTRVAGTLARHLLDRFDGLLCDPVASCLDARAVGRAQ